MYIGAQRDTMPADTWDDVNERVKAEWRDETTPFERVYEVVERTHDGQSAAEIAGRDAGRSQERATRQATLPDRSMSPP